MSITATLLGSLLGPKGPTGFAHLTGTTAPASGLGQDGQYYTDTTAAKVYQKANGSWSSGKSLIGPQGDTGPAASANFAGLGLYSVSPGNVLGTLGVITLTNTPRNLAFAGDSYPRATVNPLHEAYLISLTVAVTDASNANLTLALVQSGTGTVAFQTQLSPAAGSNAAYNFNPGDIPLTGGTTYVWQCSGNGSVGLQIFPQYLRSNGVGVSSHTLPPLATGSVSYGPFDQGMYVPGANCQWLYGSPRTASLVSVYGYNIGTSAVTLKLYRADIGQFVYTWPKMSGMTNGNVPQSAPVPLVGGGTYTFFLAGDDSNVAALFVPRVYR